MHKRLTTFFVAATAALALAGCSSTPPNASSQTPSAPACLDSGDASNGIVVSGAAGTEPAVSLSAPPAGTSMQRTVVTAGGGEAVKPSDTITIAFAIYDGTTGAKLGASGFDNPIGEVVSVGENRAFRGILNRGVACSTAGSRIALAVSSSEVEAAFPGVDLKEVAGHGIAVVFDIKSILPATRATGADQAPQDGFPSVTLDDNGAPTVKIPSTDPPGELKVEVLKKGDGPAVTENATVIVQYQGVVWGSGKIFDQSWGKSGPAPLSIATMVKGFGQGLVSQTVGSQVVIVVPPALGYGEAGNDDAGISGTDTIVFVVDILAAG